MFDLILIAEVWDVSIVNAKYGNTPIQPREEHNGFVEISGHSMDIIDASFSPDGTAIATASLDGYVKFFQVIYFYSLSLSLSLIVSSNICLFSGLYVGK